MIDMFKATRKLFCSVFLSWQSKEICVYNNLCLHVDLPINIPICNHLINIKLNIDWYRFNCSNPLPHGLIEPFHLMNVLLICLIIQFHYTCIKVSEWGWGFYQWVYNACVPFLLPLNTLKFSYISVYLTIPFSEVVSLIFSIFRIFCHILLSILRSF